MTGTSSAFSVYLILKQKHFSSRKVGGANPAQAPDSAFPVVSCKMFTQSKTSLMLVSIMDNGKTRSFYYPCFYRPILKFLLV